MNLLEFLSSLLPHDVQESGIYMILNTEAQKVYIGQTRVSFIKRFKRHKFKLNSGTHHNQYLQAAWLKYGAKAFSFCILEICTVERLKEREAHYLSLIDKEHLYNLMSVIDVFPMSAETKQKISDSCKGKRKSERTKENMSNARKGKLPKNIDKIKGWNKGIPHSPITKEKIAAAARNISDETRQKMSKAKLGNKHRLKKKLDE